MLRALIEHPRKRWSGYCFGALFVLGIAATDEVVAGAVAHPTSLNDEHIVKSKGSVMSASGGRSWRLIVISSPSLLFLRRYVEGQNLHKDENSRPFLNRKTSRFHYQRNR